MNYMNEDQVDNIETDINNKNAVEERVRKAISDKKEAETRFEVEQKARQESDAKVAQMEKETNFLNSFSDVSAKFPTASEFKDKIKEKVMTSGYSVDDATVAVLHAEGRLTSTPVQQGNVAGGSAPNQIIQSGNKTLKEHTSAERWEMLREAERRGDIGMK